MEQDDQMLSPPASTWNITRFQISAWINLNSSALPFLATFVEEVAAARIDSYVISWETGRSDVEVGNLGTQVVPVQDPIRAGVQSHLVSPSQVPFSVTEGGGVPEKETTPKYLENSYFFLFNCFCKNSPITRLVLNFVNSDEPICPFCRKILLIYV